MNTEIKTKLKMPFNCTYFQEIRIDSKLKSKIMFSRFMFYSLTSFFLSLILSLSIPSPLPPNSPICLWNEESSSPLGSLLPSPKIIFFNTSICCVMYKAKNTVINQSINNEICMNHFFKKCSIWLLVASI